MKACRLNLPSAIVITRSAAAGQATAPESRRRSGPLFEQETSTGKGHG